MAALPQHVLLDQRQADLGLSGTDTVSVENTAACLKNGAGSLVSVLLEIRQDDMRLRGPPRRQRFKLAAIQLQEGPQIDIHRAHGRKGRKQQLPQLILVRIT
jgi:hypothetical protein